jgi:hypothetical protein
MTMNIYEKMNLTAFKRFLYHFFHRIYFYAELGVWVLPLSIQI